MLLHACRVAKEQDEKERRQEWNREESCIVGITVLSHWWTPSKRSTVIGYRVTTSKRTNDGNQRIQTAVAQLLLPSFSSSFLVFSFFFLSLLVPLFPWPQPSFHDRSKNIGHWIQCNAMQISIYVISYRVRSLASRINEIWEVYAFSTISLDFFFNFYRLVEYLDWCKDEVKICEN